MTAIDERVVQMKFDNQQFESGAKTSLNTLDKLKNALSFGKASKELENLQNQGNKFSLAGIGDALDTVSLKFNAFEAMGLRVLTNIADSAYRTGTRLIKSLSVDNIAAGWKKFEDKTTSVATLISQGYDMKTVDEQLDRLNWFTDETSYNFTDMVSNISKFTASGKGLEESVNAMEGIATWASLSGQNASTASRAMYQLSQAMSAGVMRREDYKSIQNMSMDTQEFRQHALDAGVALGTLKKNADGTYQSIVKGVGKVEKFNINQFANHLTEDMWFTDKVMMKVFGDYGAAIDQIYEYTEEHGGTASDAIKALGKNVDAFGLKAFQSAQEARTFTDVLDSVKDAVSTGWMTTFELIFGNYEEAKALWTDLANELYDVFAEGGNARNEMLGEWKEMDGRTKLVESFWNAWNGVREILSLVKYEFEEIFPPMTAERLLEITESVRNLTEKFKNAFDLIESGKSIQKMVEEGKITAEEASELTEKVTTRVGNLSKTFRGIFAILDIVKQGLGAIGQLGIRLLKSILPVGDSILDITGSFGEWAENLRNSIIEGDYFGKMVDKLGPIVDKAGSVIIWVLDKLKAGFSAVTGIFKPFKKETTETAEVIEEKWSPISGLVELVRKAFSRLGEIFTGLQPILSQVGEMLGTAWDTIHEKIMLGLQSLDVKKGQDLINGGIFGILMLALNNFINKVKDAVPQGDIVKGLMKTVTDSIGAVADAIKNLAPKVDDNKPSLLELASAIGILAVSLFLVSTIDTDKLIRSVGAIGALMYALEDVVERISKLDSATSTTKSKGGVFGKVLGMFSSKSSSSDIAKTAFSMILIAAAVGVLAGSVVALSNLDWGALVKGLVGVGALLAMIVAVASLMSNMEGRIVKGAGSLILVGIAVRVLTSSVMKLAELEPDKLVNGLMAVGAILLELVAFTQFSRQFKMGSGLGLIGVAAALVIVAQAVKSLGGIQLEVLSQGMSSVAAVLGLFVVFSQTVKSKGMLKTAAAMLIMAGALHVIGAAVKSMGKLDEGSITRGVGGLAGALLTLTLVATVLGSVKGTGGAALSIMVMSGALLLLAAAFKVMASIPAMSLTKVLLAFAGALVVIGVAAAILSPLTLGILALSAAMVGIGVGILAAGMGLTALSAGIMAVGASLIVAGPMMVNAIATTLLAMLLAAYRLTTTFVEVGLGIVLNILIGIYNKLPEIVQMAVLIILKFLLTITQLFPLIIMTGVQMIISFINGMALAIRDNSEAIVMAVGNLLSSVLYLVFTAVQKIAEQIPIIGGWVADGIQGIKDGIDETFNAEDMAQIGERGMGGLVDGMESAKADASDAASGLSTAGIDGFLENLTSFNLAGEDFSLEGINGLLSNEQGYTDAGATLTADAISGADSDQFYKDFFGIGENGGDGIVDGLNSKTGAVSTAAANLANTAVTAAKSRRGLQERSPSKKMFQIGSFASQGLIDGILSLRESVGGAASSVANHSVNSMSEIMQKMATILDSDMDLNPVITPVLDLSAIQNGANSINGLFGSRSLSLATANGVTFEANRLEALNRLETNSTNADVVAALGLLRGDVNNLNTAMSGMQVVMDSGQLVGAIAQPMDNALGKRNTYRGRGI